MLMLVRWHVIALLTFFLVGCQKPPLPVSTEHLQNKSDPRQVKEADIPDIVQATPYIPPPHPAEEKYTIVVLDVPVREVLFTLTRNSRINTDIHPAIEGNVTLNAVEQTLPAILDSLSRQLDFVYEFKGKDLIIKPDLPYWHTYKVDYLNMKREQSGGSMDLAVDSGSGSVKATGTASIKSEFAMDFWDPIVGGIGKIIKADSAERAKKKSARNTEKTKSAQDQTMDVEDDQKKDKEKDKEKDKDKDKEKDKVDDALIIHKATGVIVVSATKAQHQQIQEFLDRITETAHKQVLIEATVVEVSLNEFYNNGVNWSRVTEGVMGTTINQGDNSVGAASIFNGESGKPFFTILSNIKTGQSSAISVTLQLLNEFGDVSVLSSPKIMALNNQTAIMKVGDQHVYFTAGKKTLKEGMSLDKTTEDPPIKNDAMEGLVLSVTPNIEASGIVTLHVRPVLTTLRGYATYSARDGVTGSSSSTDVPEFSVREMDSVLRVTSGQVVILGGLMKDYAKNLKTSLPGLGDVPFAGYLFGTQKRSFTKTELAIFIRPTIITPDTLREKMDKMHFSMDTLEKGWVQKRGPLPALE